jgi:predicted phosphodiesterase
MTQRNHSYTAAVLADIHGNSVALDAVLADIDSQGGVDEYWFLGDYAAIGPDPLGVLERLKTLPATTFIRGNTDRLVVDIDDLWTVTPEELDNPGFIDLFARVNRSFGWTAGAITAAGWRDWFNQLPLNKRFTLPDGTQVLLVHASPGTDDGTGFNPTQDEARRQELLAGEEADLILVGHTHVELDFTVDDIRVVNPSSIGNPLPPDLRACYALLDAGPSGYEITFQQVDYDHDLVLEMTRTVNHPALPYITAFLKGERKPGWMN